LDEMESGEFFCPGWPQAMVLLISLPPE
jgi:hypothetical protein